MNRLLQFLDSGHQCIPVSLQFLTLYRNAFFLHVVQYQGKRHLHFFHETFHACCLQLVLQHLFTFPGDIGSVAGIFHGFPGILGKQCPEISLAEYFRSARNQDTQMLRSDSLHVIIILQRVQQICCDQYVKIALCTASVQIIILALHVKGGDLYILLSGKFLQCFRDLSSIVPALRYFRKQAQLPFRFLFMRQGVKYRLLIGHRQRHPQQFFFFRSSIHWLRDQPQSNFRLLLRFFQVFQIF